MLDIAHTLAKLSSKSASTLIHRTQIYQTLMVVVGDIVAKFEWWCMMCLTFMDVTFEDLFEC